MGSQTVVVEVVVAGRRSKSSKSNFQKATQRFGSSHFRQYRPASLSRGTCPWKFQLKVAFTVELHVLLCVSPPFHPLPLLLTL